MARPHREVRGCYHGTATACRQAGSASPRGLPDSPGVTSSVAANTITAPFNDAEDLAQIFDEHGASIAAVIVERSSETWAASRARGFLQALRDNHRRHGRLLIFDEVMTGFRSRAAERNRSTTSRPTSRRLGKIIGGGLPSAHTARPRHHATHRAAERSIKPGRSPAIRWR